LFQDSSYRGHLGGIFAAIAMTKLCRKFSGIAMATVEVGCDGKEALYNASEDFSLHPGQSQYNLLSTIQQCLTVSPLTWKYRHMRGHMGNIIGHKLSWWENLSEQMDLAAKVHWADTHLLDRPSGASLSAFEGWYILYHQQKLSRIQVPLIYEALHTPATQDYWVSRKLIQPSSKHHIYWDDIGAASHKLQPSKHQWMVKHTTEIYGYGKWMEQWKKWKHMVAARATINRKMSNILQDALTPVPPPHGSKLLVACYLVQPTKNAPRCHPTATSMP
jgi:hypothetical protein